MSKSTSHLHAAQSCAILAQNEYGEPGYACKATQRYAACLFVKGIKPNKDTSSLAAFATFCDQHCGQGGLTGVVPSSEACP